jgi:hypothetical protein
MKMFLLGILAALILGGVGVVAYRAGSGKPASGGVVAIATPVPTEQLVGGDSDEHGCKGSAGYSWCESKKKCLRVWEEGCPAAEDSALIRAALFEKNNWKEDVSVKFKLQTNDGKYASGSVGGGGGGGYVFAAKVNGEWEIVADGNGVILCSGLVKYPDYPRTLIPECYDSTTGKTVKR